MFLSATSPDLVRFLDDPVDRGTVDASWRHALHLKHLLEPPDVIARLLQVRIEGGAQLRRGRLRDHLRQGANNLLFRIVDVLKLVNEKIVHRLDVSGEQAHGGSPVR